VKAFNLVFEDSVELRVREVLENKLLTILDECSDMRMSGPISTRSSWTGS